ncbi:glutaminyl-peptide cyclotransferase [Hypoxylon sp. FL1284]|nr:glutaminyl-peptide cyclotransferase [Hypoxylon sp. FL1284]
MMRDMSASVQWMRIGYIALLVFLLSATVFAYDELSDDALRSIPSGADDFDVKNGSLLSPILIPRVPGTPGSVATQRHFADFFSRHLPKWKLDRHHTTAKTPATGDTDVPFVNLIFSRDPPWAQAGDVRRLTLVAHYDSLYRPEGFIGATDSAAPCAVLMHVARSIDDALTRKWKAMEASGDAGMGLEEETGVQIVFLDGEEAWVSWTATDSLYGARALAESWDSELHPAASAYRTPLDSISLFLLLDLLGDTNPHVPSYFLRSHWAYQGMAKIEGRMRKLGLLKSKPQNPFLPESEKQVSKFSQAYIQDDHVPFMVRGVNVLHIIPTPFPDTWHTMDDDGEHLDIETLDDWAKIVTAFAAEWLGLDAFMSQPSTEGKRDAVRDRSEL